jgi:hypothetical protein
VPRTNRPAKLFSASSESTSVPLTSAHDSPAGTLTIRSNSQLRTTKWRRKRQQSELTLELPRHATRLPVVLEPKIQFSIDCSIRQDRTISFYPNIIPPALSVRTCWHLSLPTATVSGSGRHHFRMLTAATRAGSAPSLQNARMRQPSDGVPRFEPEVLRACRDLLGYVVVDATGIARHFVLILWFRSPVRAGETKRRQFGFSGNRRPHTSKRDGGLLLQPVHLHRPVLYSRTHAPKTKPVYERVTPAHLANSAVV